MDASTFDALTRRLSAGLSRRGLLVATLGSLAQVARDVTTARKRKKRKKRCAPCTRRTKGKCRGALPDGTGCPGGGCCGGVCSAALLPARKRCLGDGECCSNYCRSPSLGEKECAATCRGHFCQLDADCCRGVPCLPVEVAEAVEGNCGGCKDAGRSCAVDAHCCFSACTQPLGASIRVCASHPGGPCAKNRDCGSCNRGGDCTVTVDGVTRDICQDGVCGCPDDYDCCSNFDCDVDETCVFVFAGGDLTGECRPLLPGP